jgi:predicted ATP-grasp superfamily ATP-dependent carboligase
MNASGRRGAVVIGGDYQGLAIARSLGRRGVPVFVLDDERSVAPASRYVQASMRVPTLRDEAATVAALEASARRFGLHGWLLYPTRDETVAAIARQSERLAETFTVATPPWPVVRWAWDKRETYRLAAEHDVPAPRSWLLSELADLEAVDAPGPWVIKPAIKEHFFYATGHKAWRADDRRELAVRVREASALIGVGEVVVQELIPGGGEAQVSFCALVADGELRAVMTAQRLRQHPVDFGRATTYARTIPDPGIVEPSRRLLAAIGYHGLVELEYKLDVRDGQFKLLDFNPRTWGYHGLAQRAGVDFPYHLYADTFGLPAPDGGRCEVGVRWVRLATDLPTAALELSRGRMRVRPFMRSLFAADIEAVFSRDDPLPWLAELVLLPHAAVARGL